MAEAEAPGAGRRMRRWLLPILALAALQPTHAGETTCDGVCGRRPLAGSHNLVRIVGGSNVFPGTWPWMVSFQYITRKGYVSFCGGSLISPRWVLSAAHCFQKAKDIPWLRLSIGANRVSDPGPDAQRRSVKRLVNHELYRNNLNSSYGGVHNDISLVELDEPVNCTDYIQPACLPEDSVTVNLLGHCYISGFGTMDVATGKVADIMQEASVKLISRETCSSPDWWYKSILDENICAGHTEGGMATCKGDSGGPLVCREQRSERYFLVGVTSFGPPVCGQAQKPGVFTSTQHYLDWIRRTTNEELFLPNHPPLMVQPPALPRPQPPPRPQPQTSPWPRPQSQPGLNGNLPHHRPPKVTWITRPWPPPQTSPQTPPVAWPTTSPWPPPKASPQTPPVVWFNTRPWPPPNSSPQTPPVAWPTTRPWPPPQTSPQPPPVAWPTTRPWPPPQTSPQTPPVVWFNTRPWPPPNSSPQTPPVAWPTTRPWPPPQTSPQTPPVAWPTTRPWPPPNSAPQTPPVTWPTTRPNSPPPRRPIGGRPRLRPYVWFIPPGTRPTGSGALTPPQRPVWGLTPPPWIRRPARRRPRTRAPAWHGQIYRPWVTNPSPPPPIQLQALRPLQNQVAAPPGSQIYYKWKWRPASPRAPTPPPAQTPGE